ncbi:hypothetical protein HDU93_009326 [Gonapodya sp. JEL0774]|nr:hypothetical protein HDU93_009326 [Gonapodya sp. JEL0774]
MSLATAVSPDVAEMSCLGLDIYVPGRWDATDAGAQLRPVLVWIHGGGFLRGASSQPLYRTAGEVAAQTGCVVVCIQYRLGIFGFFATEELRNEALANGTGYGNYGLLDQIAAIEWIHSNCVAFGGDPERITLFGESAGASSIHYLLLYCPTLPIRRAIMQSGTSLRRPNSCSNNHDLYTHLLNVAPYPEKPPLDRLRAMSAGDLLRCVNDFEPNQGGPLAALKWGPTVDKDVPNGLIRVNPVQALGVGVLNRQVDAIIVGDTEDEGRSFTAQESIAGQLTEGFRFGTGAAAEGAKKAGCRVYMYRFAGTVANPRFAGSGAFHGVDIPYTFLHLVHLTPVEQELARDLVRRWGDFAARGVPGEAWEVWNVAGRVWKFEPGRSRLVQASEVASAGTHAGGAVLGALGARGGRGFGMGFMQNGAAGAPIGRGGLLEAIRNRQEAGAGWARGGRVGGHWGMR